MCYYLIAPLVIGFILGQGLAQAEEPSSEVSQTNWRVICTDYGIGRGEGQLDSVAIAKALRAEGWALRTRSEVLEECQQRMTQPNE